MSNATATTAAIVAALEAADFTVKNHIEHSNLVAATIGDGYKVTVFFTRSGAVRGARIDHDDYTFAEVAYGARKLGRTLEMIERFVAQHADATKVEAVVETAAADWAPLNPSVEAMTVVERVDAQLAAGATLDSLMADPDDAPKIVGVRVESYGTDNTHLAVIALWSGVDREDASGIVVPAKVAPRLVAAMRAGVVYGTPEILTSTGGTTFVSATCKVMGRRASADLDRLGY